MSLYTAVSAATMHTRNSGTNELIFNFLLAVY